MDSIYYGLQQPTVKQSTHYFRLLIPTCIISTCGKTWDVSDRQLGGFGLILNVSQDKPSTLQNSQMCQGQFACIIHKSNINLAFGCSGRRKGLDRVSPIDICVDVRWWEICLKHPYEVENMMVYAQKGLRMLGGKLYKNNIYGNILRQSVDKVIYIYYPIGCVLWDIRCGTYRTNSSSLYFALWYWIKSILNIVV